jgi:hypothetical protein
VDARDHGEGGDEAIVGAEDQVADVLASRNVRRFRVGRAILEGSQEKVRQAERQ